MFLDTKEIATIPKNVRVIREQDEYESRNLWKEVTMALSIGDMDKATESKCFLEQRQRDEAKERKEKNEKWETKVGFHTCTTHSNQI